MRKTTTPETASSAGRNRMIMVILAFVISLVSVAAAPASATDSWINLGNGVWVLADHNGGFVQAVVDNDADIFVDLDIRPRADGSLEWVGEDTVGTYAIDTWTNFATNGVVHSYVDSNENGTYELEYWDSQGDGKNDWVREDRNGDGWADTWSLMTTPDPNSGDAGLGIGIIRFIFDSAARSQY